MSDEEIGVARTEIQETLRLCNFFIRILGLSFKDDVPKNFYQILLTNVTSIMSSTLLVLLVGGEIACAVGKMIHTATLEEFLGSNLHVAGYGTMSLGKLVTIWYKRHTFRRLVVELADIWPVSIKDKEWVQIKRNSLSTLKYRQLMYAFWNLLGLWMYSLTPIALFVYRKIRWIPSDFGYVYYMVYPFDKTTPVIHGLVYIGETCSGCVSVFTMLGSDLLFMTMASHISMLLRLLQDQIRHLGTTESSETGSNDCYNDIVELVKIHQRLIRYINDLEDAFTVVNFINVLLSSVNICCAMFTIIFLDSWMEMGNKAYLGAALTQIFIVCWYADDIYRASEGVADAVYESGWYRSNTRSRRAMLVILQRSQRPLYFTTLKFRPITMMTFSSILTTAYSYFTLLYTSYSQ